MAKNKTTTAFLLGMIALSSSAVWASEKKEICERSTTIRKSREICMQYGQDQPQLEACAQITLFKYNTFKTQPFRDCLTISQEKNLTENDVKACGKKSGTHTAFTNCLKKI
jgi:hypothetical protein